ncbi:MAG TPA: hypothetical protein VF790_06175 [Dissulfurispiraceae bacterium]
MKRRRSSISGGVVRWGCCAVLALNAAGVANIVARASASGDVNVTIENISYQGDSKYKVEVVVDNRSDEAIDLKEWSKAFYVQTEILGRWERLRSSCMRAAASTLLPPRKSVRELCTLNIPLTIPSLYRNNDGEINVRFKYMMRSIPGLEAGIRSEEGESSYWIKPETDTWVLREGM